LDDDDMAKERKNETSDGRHLVAVGLPLGTVLGILILGALLQSGPSHAVGDGPAPIADPLPPPPSYVVSRQLPPDTEPAPTVASADPADGANVAHDSSVSALGRRALEDVDRLSSATNRWTSQVGVFCDTAHVATLVQQFQDSTSLFVLPAMIQDQACFRVCWGRYDDQDRARQARDLPAALRGGGTFPRRISSVLQ
jgi:septal ring-binding cell division protein DamX